MRFRRKSDASSSSRFEKIRVSRSTLSVGGNGAAGAVDAEDVEDIAWAMGHPHLRIEVMLDDRNQDMVKEAVDVGIRVGRLPDATGTTKLIGKMRRVAVASPAYLARHGTPQVPLDIEKHRIVAGPAAMQASSWQFQRDGETVQVAVQPHISTNDTAGAVAAAASGLGITSSTSWGCRRELNQGALTRLLPDWEMAELPVHAYFPFR